MTIRAISLFCGAGGFCEGARLAGWQVVSAVESDPQACRTHAANFPEVLLHEGRARSNEAILRVIDELRERGYSFVIPADEQLV